MADSFDFDLFVIGGGSGGVRAARVAAGEYGAKVGLAEGDRLTGHVLQLDGDVFQDVASGGAIRIEPGERSVIVAEPLEPQPRAPTIIEVVEQIVRDRVGLIVVTCSAGSRIAEQ